MSNANKQAKHVCGHHLPSLLLSPPFSHIPPLTPNAPSSCTVSHPSHGKQNVQSTPYGRFGNGPAMTMPLDPKVGWWLMELPCSVLFWVLFWVRGGPQARKPAALFAGFVFTCHYLYRGWAFPLLLNVQKGTKNFDLSIALGSWMVTSVHATLNAWWFSTYGKHLSKGGGWAWLKSTQFRVGALMYYSGLALVIWHDHIMRVLRPCPGGARYCIPQGGLFDYATAAHYLSELWMWLGFAVMFGGPGGMFIFLVSLVNLVPRSAATHSWYLSKFDNYASLERARLVPFLW